MNVYVVGAYVVNAPACNIQMPLTTARSVPTSSATPRSQPATEPCKDGIPITNEDDPRT
jgi:hypothetical protein